MLLFEHSALDLLVYFIFPPNWSSVTHGLKINVCISAVLYTFCEQNHFWNPAAVMHLSVDIIPTAEPISCMLKFRSRTEKNNRGIILVDPTNNYFVTDCFKKTNLSYYIIYCGSDCSYDNLPLLQQVEYLIDWSNRDVLRLSQERYKCCAFHCLMLGNTVNLHPVKFSQVHQNVCYAFSIYQRWLTRLWFHVSCGR